MRIRQAFGGRPGQRPAGGGRRAASSGDGGRFVGGRVNGVASRHRVDKSDKDEDSRGGLAVVMVGKAATEAWI